MLEETTRSTRDIEALPGILGGAAIFAPCPSALRSTPLGCVGLTFLVPDDNAEGTGAGVAGAMGVAGAGVAGAMGVAVSPQCT